MRRNDSLTLADVEFTITPEEEASDPRSSYAVPGIIAPNSPDADRFVKAVEAMIDAHDLWGWCEVTVTAHYAGLHGDAYLGGCSYRDEADFIAGGYYEQMQAEALADLQATLESINSAISIAS